MDDQQRFEQEVCGYDFFARGAMDVEEHCVLLAQALTLDGVSDAPSPNRLFEHMLSITDRASRSEEVADVQRSVIGPSVRFSSRIHPNGQLTLLHPSTALMMFDDYVVSLGAVLGIAPSGQTPQTGYWIDPGWRCTAALMDAFYKSIENLIHRLDFPLRQAVGYSGLDAMRLAILDPSLEPEGLLDAWARNSDHLLRSAETAVAQGAHSESVLIVEQLLSAGIKSALEMHRIKPAESLAGLIKAARALDQKFLIEHADDLWDRADAWRRWRNLVAHGETTSVFTLPPDPSARDRLAKDTAGDGISLAREIRAWSIEARAHSMGLGLPHPAAADAKR